jgi:hypothetical protein
LQQCQLLLPLLLALPFLEAMQQQDVIHGR